MRPFRVAARRGLSAAFGVVLSNLLLVGSVMALTCPYPERSVERMLAVHDAAGARDRFVAYGVLTSLEPLPDFDHAIQTRPTFEARFEGYLARPSGFDTRAIFEVSVISSCIYHDVCGSVPGGPDAALMLIQQREGRFVFHASVCNDDLLLDPTEGELARAIACLDRESCPSP